MNRTSNTVPTLVLIALLMLAIPAAAAAKPVVHPAHESAANVRAYWTKARMKAAEPVTPELSGAADLSGELRLPVDRKPPSYVPSAAPGSSVSAELLDGKTTSGTAAGDLIATPVVDPTASGIRAHGKVFFTITGGSDPDDFVCSGTAINSRNKSVVMTAGHCVYDAETGGGKAVNWTFVPAYQAGAEPYGEWPAKKLATTKQWKERDFRYDLGVGVVRHNSSGQRLQSVVGARGIGFDQPRKQTYGAYGYPALAPFTGELEFLCDSVYQGTDSPGGQGPKTMAIGCDMTGGASGGGWVVDNKLLSVTSYGYPNEPGVLYGPYLSTTAKKLYKKVRGK